MKTRFFTLLMALGATIFNVITASADVLVATGSSIVKVSDSGTKTFISQPVASMFYEKESEKLYFATTSGIFRADKDGKNVTTLIANVGTTIGGLVVDTSNERIIWTEPSEHQLRSSNLSGGDIQEFYFGVSLPKGIAISQSSGRVYWTSGAGSIETTDLAGNNWDEIFYEFTDLRGLVLVGDTIYFADYDGGKLRSVKTNGTGESVVLSGLTAISAVAYDPDLEKLVYIGQHSNSHLASVSLNGSNKVQLAAQKGFSLIAGFGSESELIYEPEEPPTEPDTEPAPEERPPYTLMYMSIQNTKNTIKSRVIATNYYRESEDVAFEYVSNPRAIGYSKAQNSLFVVDRAAPSTTRLIRANTDGLEPKFLFSNIYHYESILVDDKHNRIFLGQARDDFAEYRMNTGSLYRLYNRSGNNALGFGRLDGKLVFANRMEQLHRKLSGGAITRWWTYSDTPVAVTDIDDGTLTLLRRDNGEDFVAGDGENNKIPAYFGLGIYFGTRPYNYEHMALQHLDPETFDYPYALYLASGNKVDVMVFLPHPVIVPFMRFDEDEVVTGMVEVPLDGSVEHNDPVGSQTIKGSVNFVNFNTGPNTLANSAGGVQVHLTLEKSIEQLSGERLNQTARTTLTDANGNYVFNGLIEGATYRIRFSRNDLVFSGSGIRVRSGSAAPPVFASEDEVVEFGCNRTIQNRRLRRADNIHNRIVAFAVNRSSQRFERVPPRARARMQTITARLNANHEALLESSQELPSVRLQCIKSSPCTVSTAPQAARAYRRNARRLANVSRRLINVSFRGRPNRAALLTRINRMTSSAARVSQRIPTRTFACPNSPRYEE